MGVSFGEAKCLVRAHIPGSWQRVSSNPSQGFTLPWSPETQSHCGLGCWPIPFNLPGFHAHAGLPSVGDSTLPPPPPVCPNQLLMLEETGLGDGQAFKRSWAVGKEASKGHGSQALRARLTSPSD